MAETLKQRLRRFSNSLLHPLGLHLSRRERAFEMDGVLARAAARGFRPGTVIDVGASDGQWSLAARRHFPAAQYVLFEPLREHAPALADLHTRFQFHIVSAAAGARRGEVGFVVDPKLDGSSVASDQPGDRRVPVETVDDTLVHLAAPAPYCLKLDTHGFELAVLEGARRVLESTDGLLVIEAYNFALHEGAPRFHELCAWLDARGWRCCDLADPMRRPSDGVLWQMDLAFARANSAWFGDNRYA